MDCRKQTLPDSVLKQSEICICFRGSFRFTTVVCILCTKSISDLINDSALCVNIWVHTKSHISVRWAIVNLVVTATAVVTPRSIATIASSEIFSQNDTALSALGNSAIEAPPVSLSVTTCCVAWCSWFSELSILLTVRAHAFLSLTKVAASSPETALHFVGAIFYKLAYLQLRGCFRGTFPSLLREREIVERVGGRRPALLLSIFFLFFIASLDVYGAQYAMRM